VMAPSSFTFLVARVLGPMAALDVDLAAAIPFSLSVATVAVPAPARPQVTWAINGPVDGVACMAQFSVDGHRWMIVGRGAPAMRMALPELPADLSDLAMAAGATDPEVGCWRRDPGFASWSQVFNPDATTPRGPYQLAVVLTLAQ
jgi:hypothetical protein